MTRTDIRKWKDRAHTTVEMPSGFTYEVHAVELAELTGIWGALPGFLPEPEEAGQVDREQAARMSWATLLRDPERVRKIQRVVALGVHYPPIGEGEDKVAISEIPVPHLFELLTTIMALSHMGDEEREGLRPMSSDPSSA